MHAETLRGYGRKATVCRVLSCQGRSLKLSGTTHLRASRRCGGQAAIRLAPEARAAGEGGTPGSKFAGGHRIRVTPVPIPNTEVKPDTADGTAWETVWESRSLPALFAKARSSKGRSGFFYVNQKYEVRRQKESTELVALLVLDWFLLAV
jgi:hypothetical protein